MSNMTLLTFVLISIFSFSSVFGDTASEQQSFVIQTRISAPSLDGSKDSISKEERFTVLKDEDATFREIVKSPFVVAVNTIRGNLAEAHQPVIRVLDTGLTGSIRVSHVNDGWATLDITVKESRISRVGEQKIDTTTTVQVPVVTTSITQAIKTVQFGKVTALELRREGRKSPSSEIQLVVCRSGIDVTPWDTEVPAAKKKTTTGRYLARLVDMWGLRVYHQSELRLCPR